MCYCWYFGFLFWNLSLSCKIDNHISALSCPLVFTIKHSQNWSVYLDLKNKQPCSFSSLLDRCPYVWYHVFFCSKIVKNQFLRNHTNAYSLAIWLFWDRMQVLSVIYLCRCFWSQWQFFSLWTFWQKFVHEKRFGFEDSWVVLLGGSFEIYIV